MQIVVNHLTRMRDGHVCVAGLDRDGRHYRPVLEHGRLDHHFTREYDGPFAMGVVVEIEGAWPRPVPPAVEDYVFDPAQVRVLRCAEAARFWEFLEGLANPCLGEIFGDSLARDGNSASIPAGMGTCSLGVFRPNGRPSLVQRFGRLRLEIRDPELGLLSLPLTDLRIFNIATGAIDDRRVELLADRLRRRDVLLSVGVSRAWARDGDVARHWLQANNAHLADNPLWPN